MIVNIRMYLKLAAIFLVLPLAVPAATAFAEEGHWSKQAFSIPRQRAFKVPSPDRKKTVMIADLSLAVVDSGAALSGIEGYTLLLPAEISWAPDSKAFVITSNEGGSGEEAWFITVYMLDNERVNVIDVTAEAADRFKEQIKCPDAGEPHVGAVKWVKESKNLLIVAEAPARVLCAAAGTFRGFIVEIPSGKVLKELSPKTLSDEWGEYLGPRFAKKSFK